MKPYILIFSLLTVICLSSGKSSKGGYKSQWRSDAPSAKLDTISYRTYDKESGIVYSISNNSEYIFINFRCDKESAKKQILESGFTLWIDTTKSKSKANGISFPLKSANWFYDNAILAKIKNSIPELELTGFGLPETYHTYAKNETGISAALALDSNYTLYYAAKIPLKKLYRKANFQIDSTQNYIIGLCSGSDKDGNNNVTDHNSRSLNNNQGGVGGGLTGGGNNNTGMPGSSQIDRIQTEINATPASSALKLWIKFNLSVNKPTPSH